MYIIACLESMNSPSGAIARRTRFVPYLRAKDVALNLMRSQGTLLITLVGSQSRQAIDDNELRRKMQQFGDVKAIKPVFANGMMRHE